MIVLSGSNTILASYLIPILRNEFPVCAFDSERGNIRDPEFIEKLFSEMKPTMFVNCAQNENLDECEYKREDAYGINGIVPGIIADICSVKKTKFVQISSQYVFDCQGNTPYREEDNTHPATIYGDSKAMAEKKIIESGCPNLIVRIPHIYGKGECFLSSMIEKIKDAEQIVIPAGQRIMPTFANDAALMIASLIRQGSEGIVNCGNDGVVKTRQFIYEFATRLGRRNGRDYIVNLSECDSKEYLSPYDIPMFCALDLAKIKGILGKVRSWDDALEDFLETSSVYL